MKISVVIPVFNTKAEYLRMAVESVLLQSYPCHELIVVNDGSTRKETLQELNTAKYGYDKYDIIKVIDQENKKISGALNTGIRHMTGDWWTGCGSDDTWLPDKLKEQVSFIEKHPDAKVIYCDWDYIDAKGNVIKHFTEPEFKDRIEAGKYIIRNYFGTWGGMMIHRSVFDAVGLFNEAFPTREDYEMNIRILIKFMMYRVPKTLFTYRLHPEQLTNSAHAGARSADGKRYTEIARDLAIAFFGDEADRKQFPYGRY